MSSASGKGQAYIIFDYDQALRIYDSVTTRRSQLDSTHCSACESGARNYDQIVLELVEFFNAVDISYEYVQARARAKEAHDASQSPSGKPSGS